MSRKFLRARKVLWMSAASVTAGLLLPVPGRAQAQSAVSADYSTLYQIQKIIPNPQSPIAGASGAASHAISALPFQAPPINGFQPFIVYGLTNEQDPNSFESPESDVPGGTAVPNPAQYFVATLDSGSESHILSYADAQAINLDANGLAGAYTVEATGAGGSGATETLDISDALGSYATGLANATVNGNSVVVSPSTMRGTSNTSILTAEQGSVLPSLLGQPQFASYQVQILNSQTQRLTVNGTTYQGPQITFTPFASAPALPSTYVSTTLDPLAPPTGFGSGGTNSEAVFIPNFSDQSYANDPISPTVWNGLYLNVSMAGSGGSNSGQQQFLLDTGAQVSVISTQTANSIGIQTGGSNPTPPDFYVTVLGVGGESQVPGYIISSLTINTSGGNKTWTNVPVILQDVQDPRDGVGFVPGILGMNLFTDRDLIINGDLNNPYFAFTENSFTPQWTGTAGGNWSDNSKWLGGVPSTTGMPANFTSNTPAPQTINVDGDFTFSSLSFDNTGGYTISGNGTLTLEADIGTAAISVLSGSHTISAPMKLASSTAINISNASDSLTISSDVTADSAIITKLGAGTLAMKNIRSAALNINAGKVSILSNGSATGVSKIGSLSISSGALFDITNNKLVVGGSNTGTFDTASQSYTGVTGMVASGRGASGHWDGTTGITSSSIGAGDTLHSIGVASAADVLQLSGTQTGTWNGQTVDATDTLVMYTYGGDANLDGKINIDDYGRIDGNVGSSGSVFGWYNGDFNYDGKINIDDYGIIDGNIGQQGAPLNVNPSVIAVPEPAAIGLIVLGMIGFLGTRRRLT